MSEFEAFAKNVVRRSLKIRPKENVIVEAWNHGLGLGKEFVYQIRAVGARPMFLFEDEETYWRSVETLPTGKLGQVSKSEWAALAQADVYIFVPGPADIARHRKNMEKAGAATAYNSEWYKRAEKAGLRGARVLLGYASRERAASYGFDFDGWRGALISAGSADLAAIARKGRAVARWLSKEADVEVSAPNGTRLTFRLRGREAHVDDGIVDAEDLKAGEFMTNVPPGSAFVTPDEKSAEGTVVFDRAGYSYGLTIPDVRFEFKHGRVTWSASANDEMMRSQYDRAKGAKDLLGFLSIGLNPSASYGFLNDDLVAGSVEIDIGDNAEYGGRNRSAFSFGARLSQATVRVGRKVLVDAGRLAV